MQAVCSDRSFPPVISNCHCISYTIMYKGITIIYHQCFFLHQLYCIYYIIAPYYLSYDSSNADIIVKGANVPLAGMPTYLSGLVATLPLMLPDYTYSILLVLSVIF